VEAARDAEAEGPPGRGHDLRDTGPLEVLRGERRRRLGDEDERVGTTRLGGEGGEGAVQPPVAIQDDEDRGDSGHRSHARRALPDAGQRHALPPDLSLVE
jgi:hypothetical protein